MEMLAVSITVISLFCLHGSVIKATVVGQSSNNNTQITSQASHNNTLCFNSGRDSLPGRDGRDGLQGPAGPAGLPGLKGSKGDMGSVGQKGETSAPGPRGLLGAKGEKGERGYTGSQGQRGVQGFPGSKGSKGARGYTGPPGSPAGGVTYNRWGSSTCRSGVTRVYAGRTGATYAHHKGGAANYLCMPNDPEYTLSFHSDIQGRSYVFGAEYEDPVVSGRTNHNAPCAVCYLSTKNTVLMIPAKTSCPSGWTREYYGYLMSEHNNLGRTMYECVDKDMESVPGSQAHVIGGHFFHVEAHCNGMACPPYNNGKELTCVVCSK